MVIHVVQSGDTLSSLARQYGVPLSLLSVDNGVSALEALVPGQALVVRVPSIVHTVRPGDTLFSIARQYGVTMRQLYRNNLALEGQDAIWPGQTIVVAYDDTPGPEITVNAYAYPNIDNTILTTTLPFLTYLTPFTYGFTPTGALVELNDYRLLAAASRVGTAGLMSLSTLTQEGGFSNELAHRMLNDPALRDQLIENVILTIQERGYRGLDVDFEYIYAQDAAAYAAFVDQLRQRLSPLGYPVIVALAPKTSATHPGILYEGHDFAALGAAADRVLLMTYEWGYTYGPPMPVAPLPNVRQVVEYALTEIPGRKIWLGVPNYGYDWPLPYVQGRSRATSISSQQAVALARQFGVDIQYDDRAQAPWFRYTDKAGIDHEVWFEDARSIRAKLALISEYGLAGAGYWNLMRDFPQNWLTLAALYQIRQV